MNKIKSILIKPKKSSDFSCFCNRNLKSILTKPKKSQLGNTITTFVATIIIIVILLLYVIVSAAVKTFSDKGIDVVKGENLGLSDVNEYVWNGFYKVSEFKVDFYKNKDISKFAGVLP